MSSFIKVFQNAPLNQSTTEKQCLVKKQDCRTIALLRAALSTMRKTTRRSMHNDNIARLLLTQKSGWRRLTSNTRLPHTAPKSNTGRSQEDDVACSREGRPKHKVGALRVGKSSFCKGFEHKRWDHSITEESNFSLLLSHGLSSPAYSSVEQQKMVWSIF